MSVTLPDGRMIEYIHDPLGRRIAKKVDGVIVAKYLWQGLTRLLAVYDGADNLLTRFEYDDDRMPIAMTSDGSTFYLSYNQIGTLRLVVDNSGNVIKNIDYDSFGNILSDSNPGLAVPFGFAGGLLDSDTGLVRFGYRDYDPDTGRWTAKDPILFAGGDSDLYGYVLNNPINFVDPTGLFGEGGWFGTRPRVESNTTGFQGSDNFFGGEEGPVMNALDNYVPGFHSYSSLFHDPVVTGMMDAGWGSWIKFPSMVLTLPAVPGFAIMDTLVDAFRPDNQGCK